MTKNPNQSNHKGDSWLTLPRVQFENMKHVCKLSDFKMTAQLGQGAYGKVVKVKTKESQNEYAMKIVPKQMIENLHMIDQQRNEVNIMSMIKHENIIELKTYFEDNRHIYFILELAEDKHLYSRLKLKGKYPEKTASQFIYDTLKAQDYLHTRSPPIIHRDIKPENILFVDGKAKLADFGWCNLKDDFRNTYCGTPDYLAPEMIREKGHNEKLDIWTVGVLTFELLTGKAPFAPSKTVKDKKKAQEQLEDNILNNIPTFTESLSKDAVEIVSLMLNKDSDKRPSAGELLNHKWFKAQWPEQFMNKSQENMTHSPGSSKNVRKQNSQKIIQNLHKFEIKDKSGSKNFADSEVNSESDINTAKTSNCDTIYSEMKDSSKFLVKNPNAGGVSQNDFRIVLKFKEEQLQELEQKNKYLEQKIPKDENGTEIPWDLNEYKELLRKSKEYDDMKFSCDSDRKKSQSFTLNSSTAYKIEDTLRLQIKEKDLEIIKLENKVSSKESELRFKSNIIDQLNFDSKVTVEKFNKESEEYKSRIRETNILLQEKVKTGTTGEIKGMTQQTINLILFKFEELQKLTTGYISKQKDIEEKLENYGSLKDKLAKLSIDKELEISGITRQFDEDMTIKTDELERSYLIQIHEASQKYDEDLINLKSQLILQKEQNTKFVCNEKELRKLKFEVKNLSIQLEDLNVTLEFKEEHFKSSIQEKNTKLNEVNKMLAQMQLEQRKR